MYYRAIVNRYCAMGGVLCTVGYSYSVIGKIPLQISQSFYLKFGVAGLP